MEAPGPPAVRARSRRGRSGAWRGHARRAGLQVPTDDRSEAVTAALGDSGSDVEEDLGSSFTLDVAKDSGCHHLQSSPQSVFQNLKEGDPIPTPVESIAAFQAFGCLFVTNILATEAKVRRIRHVPAEQFPACCSPVTQRAESAANCRSKLSREQWNTELGADSGGGTGGGGLAVTNPDVAGSESSTQLQRQELRWTETDPSLSSDLPVAQKGSRTCTCQSQDKDKARKRGKKAVKLVFNFRDGQQFMKLIQKGFKKLQLNEDI